VRMLLRDFDYVLEPLGGHANYVCRPRAASLSDGPTT